MEKKAKSTEKKELSPQERLKIVLTLKEKALKGKQKFISSVGRRKRSIARLWLYEKRGEFLVNDEPISKKYSKPYQTAVWIKPFHLVGISHPTSKFSATIKVHGGGTTGQLGAIQLAFSRALVAINPEYRPILRSAGLLTRDPREVERKKTSQPKARKKEQYSKR